MIREKVLWLSLFFLNLLVLIKDCVRKNVIFVGSNFFFDRKIKLNYNKSNKQK